MGAPPRTRGGASSRSCSELATRLVFLVSVQGERHLWLTDDAAWCTVCLVLRQAMRRTNSARARRGREECLALCSGYVGLQL